MGLDTLFYNIRGIYYLLLPKNPKPLISNLKQIKDNKLKLLKERLDYYCNLPHQNISPSAPPPSKKYSFKSKIAMLQESSRYCYDFWEFMRYLSPNLYYHLEQGDVNYHCLIPSFCKSRPICPHPNNNILLKLDKKRHFGTLEKNTTLRDIPYLLKKDKLFFRGGCYQTHRQKFMHQFFSNPMVDAGHVGSLQNNLYRQWYKGKASLQTHLKHKFILSLEGNDVATNLKWIMASSSLVIMPKPKFETWFMEGKLKDGIHYIQINQNYDNLESSIEYLLSNPTIAQEIIQNANHYTKKFLDVNNERLLNFLVIRKFFYQSKQIEVSSIEEELFA